MTSAMALRRRRHRSSSRCSRNGISPRAGVSATGAGLAPECLKPDAGEVGLVRTRVPRDHPVVVRPGLRLVRLFGEEAELVERGGRPDGVGVALHELCIHRRGGIGLLLTEALPDIEEGVGGPRVRREGLEERPEPHPRRRHAALPVLLQRGVVHLIRAGPRNARRRAPARVGCRHRLRGALLDLRAELRQPLLALARELLHAHQLLIDVEVVVLRVAPHLHQIVLLRGERLLDGRDGRQDAVPLRTTHRIGTGHLRLKSLDLETDLPDVALEGASGGHPEAEEREVSRGSANHSYGFTRASPPARMENSSRRFLAQASSVCPASSGRSSPFDTVSMRPASMPCVTRYCFAALARRLPRARLYSWDPRSSQLPAIWIRSPGFFWRMAIF